MIQQGGVTVGCSIKASISLLTDESLFVAEFEDCSQLDQVCFSDEWSNLIMLHAQFFLIMLHAQNKR